MKKFIILCFYALIISVFTEALGQAVQYSKVKISLTQQTMQQIAALGIATDHGDFRKNSYFESDLSETEIQQLAAAGFDYEIVVQDVVQYYRDRNMPNHNKTGVPPIAASSSNCTSSPIDYAVPTNFSLGSMAGFFTYAEFLAHLDTMVSKFPNLISARQQIDTITTHDGNPIYWLRISDNPNIDENEPEVLYTALHHAREPGSMSQLIFYMYYLLENYGIDSTITNLVDNTEMYFIPMVNPDGYIYNETTSPGGGGMWRKNRKNNGDGTFGVDLNRNYGYFWGYDDNGSSPNTSSNVYRGTGPFSEPETQATKFMFESHNFRLTLNYHCYGNLFIYPWGYEYSLFTPDSAIFVEYAKIMTYYNLYTYGTGDQTVGYVVNGDSDDWMYGEQISKPKSFSCTPEIGTASDGFWPPSTRIIPQCKENIWANLTLARLAGKYAIAEDLRSSYVSQASGYLPFNIRRLGLDSPATYTVAIIPLGTNIDSIGSPISFSGMSLLEDRVDSFYYALDTSTTVGQTFSFVLTLNNGLYLTSDTITKTLGQLTSLFFEDADNISNWNTSQWETSSSVYYTPSASITDSEFGDYNNNTSIAVTLSNPIDLTTAMKANLTFWGRWELEPGYDYTQVEASINGGSTWTPLCGKYTKPGSGYQDPGNPVYDGFQSNWVFEEVDLNDYVGESVLIRFNLQSDNWTTADGYYFDELNINVITNNLTLSISSVDGTCGNDDGSAAAVITGGMLPYTIQWDDPGTSTTASISGLAVGIYRVTVTDNIGLSFTDSVEIINLGAPTLTVTTTPVTCYGGNDGGLNINPVGGTLPYTYAWSPGGPTSTSITAGTYAITVTDGNGCAAVVSAIVTEPPEMVISVSSTDVTCFGGIDGTVNATASGSTPPYNYSWSGGGSTTALAAGAYNVTVVDGDGCTAVAATTINEPSEIVATANITNDIDSTSSGAIDLTPGGGTGTLTFAWSTSETTEDIGGLLPGDYTVIITDAVGCNISQTHTVDYAVGIPEFNPGLGVSIFPNPSSGNFALEFEQRQQLIVLSVTDLLGRLILAEEIHNAKSHIISLSTQTPGVYFLKLSAESGSEAIRKLVIY